MKLNFLFGFLFSLGMFSFVQAQTIEELFSIEGLSINAHFDDLYDIYPESFTFYQKTTLCDGEILEYINNKTGNRSYLKVEDQKVYRVYPSSNCYQSLIYDFGLEIGEQISEGVYQGATLVNKYEGTLENGEPRMFYDIEGIEQLDNATWVEGIGDIDHGLFPSYGDEGSTVLICAKIGDELLWGNNSELCDQYNCINPIVTFDTELNDLTLEIVNQSSFATSYLWDFGDGNTSTDTNPVYEYEAPGCYTISVTVSNECTTQNTSYEKFVSVCIDEAWEVKTTFDETEWLYLTALENGIQFARGGEGNLFAKSTDNGATWTDLPIPPPSDSTITRSIRDIAMFDENNGIVALSNLYGYNEKGILVTHDGGLTWEEKVEEAYQIKSVEIGSSGTAWADPLSVNSIFKTDDYGDTWEEISLWPLGSLFQLEYIHDGLLVASIRENNSDVLTYYFATSTDGGYTWNTILLPDYIKGIQAFDELNIYGIGPSGMYKTTDGGNSWELINTEVTNDWGRLVFFPVNENVMWVKGNDDIMYYTTDGWQTHVVRNCFAIDFLSFNPISETKVLATAGGSILEYDAENVIFCSTENAAFELNTKVLLEGAYDGNGTMKTLLTDVLPLEQPYNIAPYNYTGTEALSNIPTNMVDWVLVEMRSGTPDLVEANTEVVETKAGILQADGSITGVNGEALQFTNLTVDENYYICIRHRNHLDILSANPVIAQASMTYDFTSNMNQAFGDFQQKEMEDGKVVLHVGDYTQDGVIQISDFDAWKADPATINTYNVLDGTLDNVVQVTDFDAWILNKAKLGVIEVQY